MGKLASLKMTTCKGLKQNVSSILVYPTKLQMSQSCEAEVGFFSSCKLTFFCSKNEKTFT